MARPFISIVMPVYNGGHYFPKSVASALAQTYDRFEIVMVNDGSTDGGKTAAFCERMVSERPDRFQYVDQPNGGVGSALNAGIRTMKGDVFCWLSHDDLYVPNKLERQVDFFHRLTKPDAMLISDYALIDPHDRLKVEVKFDHASFIRAPKLPLYRGCVNGCTVFVPRKLLPEQPFKAQYRHTQDYWLWFELLKKYTFFHQPEILVRYRQHPGQDSLKPEAATEGEELWRTAVDDTTELLRSQLYGSSWKFYDETHTILEPAYKQVATYLLNKRNTCLGETLVSVVVPFYNEVQSAVRAAQSVLSQTHRHVELIMINDGSTETIELLETMARSDPRMRILHKENGGPASARNLGLDSCRGDYIAFLDADDIFMPNKITVQLEAMARAGARISHTSYAIAYPQRFSNLSELRSGRQTGRVYPEILGHCSIATPTVMIHRSILTSGFRFPDEHRLGEDILAWTSVLMREDLLGIDQALTVVEWSDTSAAVSITKGISGVKALADRFRAHPVHRRYEDHIAKLDEAVSVLEGLYQKHSDVNVVMVDAMFKRATT